MRRFFSVTLATVSLVMSPAAFADNGLVTQLDQDHVDIGTYFSGGHVFFFGSLSRPGDVIVKVVSPMQDVAVSQKTQIGPFWLDGGRVLVKHTPGLLYLASTKPVNKLLNAAEQEKHGLSLAHYVQLAQKEGDSLPGWDQAFLRLKKGRQYYRELDDGVTMVKNRLFFIRLDLPAKLPEGEYKVQAYLVNGGKVVAQEQTEFNVQEVSLERWVSTFARGKPWIYGVSLTLMCIVIGLSLSMLLRQSKDD